MRENTIFLDKNYLETRLRDFKAIRKKEVFIEIKNSCNGFSKSLYVGFWVGRYKGATLRVSDHIVNTNQVQFIVNGDILTKKKNAEFERLVNKCISKAKALHLDKVLKVVDKLWEWQGITKKE